MNAIHLEASLSGGRIECVRARISKVDIAGRLGGMGCGDVVRVLPMLYGVCARAHGAAATAAVAAACADLAAGAGATDAIAGSAASSADVVEEAVRELLLAVFAGPARSLVRECAPKLRNPPGLLASVETALGTSAERWLQLRSLDELRRWSGHTDSLLAHEFQRRFALPEPTGRSDLLPVLDAAASLAAGDAEWLGKPAETGAISREWSRPLTPELIDRPLLHRWIARLVELLRYCSSDTSSVLGRVCAIQVAEGHGRATVETARGLLIHDVLISGGKVVRYRLLAPTEWNFHPHGAVRRWLEGLPAESPAAAMEWMQRVCEALDPCMECHISVSDALTVSKRLP